MTRRQRSFYWFDRGLSPAETATKAGISKKTSRKYYSQWKKLPRCLEERYRIVKKYLKLHPESSQPGLKHVADQLDIPLEELRERLEEPWGLKRLMMGRWLGKAAKGDTPAAADKYKQWNRLKTAIDIIYLCEVRGVPGERIVEELEKLNEQYHRPKAKGE
jgi:hypothetical protein